MSSSSISLTVAPSVLFSIAETYQRRSDLSKTRVVGALLGTFRSAASSGELHINHSFVVPHSEVADQIAINSEYYKQRLDLHKKGYGSDSVLVGWFSMAHHGAMVSENNTNFINDSFAREVANGGQCPVVVHLNLKIAEDGTVERLVSTTDLVLKSQSVSTITPVFSSADSFAVRSSLRSIQIEPTLDLADVNNSEAFLKEQAQELTSQVEMLEQQRLETAADKATIDSLRTILKASKPIADASSLGSVCDSISSQLHCLESLVHYQP